MVTVLGYRTWLWRALIRNLVFCFPCQRSTKGQNPTKIQRKWLKWTVVQWNSSRYGKRFTLALLMSGLWPEGPCHPESSLALLHSWNINCTYFWGSLWRGNDDICNRLGAYYAQYSSVKSHLRTASLPKWKSSGIRKGFPTWSRSFLKKRTVLTHH